MLALALEVDVEAEGAGTLLLLSLLLPEGLFRPRFISTALSNMISRSESMLRSATGGGAGRRMRPDLVLDGRMAAR